MKLRAAMVLVTIITSASCTCEEYACPAFSAQDAANWLQDRSATTFQDARGSRRFVFVEQERKLSSAYGEDQTSIAFNCRQNDCFATAAVQGTLNRTNDRIPFRVDIVNNFYGNKHVALKLNYTLGDMSGSFLVMPQFSPQGNTEKTVHREKDSIAGSIRLGSVDHTHVVIQSRNMSHSIKY
jgi:hypothetical protein